MASALIKAMAIKMAKGMKNRKASEKYLKRKKMVMDKRGKEWHKGKRPESAKKALRLENRLSDYRGYL